MVRENTPLQPDDLADLFSAAAGDNDMFNEGNLTLLYIMSRSNTMDMSDTKIPLYDFFMSLVKCRRPADKNISSAIRLT